MNVNAYPLSEFKADGGSGLFAALVSAFGNKDLNGDRVMPGAFTDTLERWREKGTRIPVVWSHGHDNPEDFIGEVDPKDIKQTEKGLVVAGKFFVDESPRAASIFDLMKRGLISAWSFAFAPVYERMGEDGTREIHALDLFEVGPTLIGANPEAQTIALKALGEPENTATDSTEDKRGRSISAANRTILTRLVEQHESAIKDISSLLGTEEEAPLTDVDRHRLALAEIDEFLSSRR